MRKRSVNFPDDVYDALLARARQDGRRFGPEVVWLLRQALSEKVLPNNTLEHFGTLGNTLEHFGTLDNTLEHFGTLGNTLHLTEKQRAQLLELAGSEEVLAQAIARAELVEPGKMKSPFGYVRRILENWRKEGKVLPNNTLEHSGTQSNTPSIVVGMTEEELAKERARIPSLLDEYGWGD